MEDLKELESQINILEYIKEDLGIEPKKINENTYRINPCPVCGHNDHFTIYTDTNSYSSFSDCCKGGSILKYMQEVEKLELNTAVKKLYELTGQTYNKDYTYVNVEYENKDEFLANQKKEFILDGIRNQTPEQKEEVYRYMAGRGISKKTVDKYNLFLSCTVYEDKTLGTEGTIRVVIPVISSNGENYSYVARAVSEEFNGIKTLNNAGEQTALNIDYIKQPAQLLGNKTIYICEGWADALSIEDSEKKSIALHSSSNVKKFLGELENNIDTAKDYTYILCFDNDKAGIEATKTAIAGMDHLGIKHLEIDIPSKYNDINEWYKNEPDNFKIGLDPFAVDNMENYMTNKFLEDIMYYSLMGSVKTGFKELDEKLGGLSGVTVIGGGSSIGKTTFVNQICDFLAQHNDKVIYFSLEQGKLELVSKSISREEAIEYNIINAESSSEIMNNPEPVQKKQVLREKAINKYKKYAQNILIVEGKSNTNINSIKSYIEGYISTTGYHPIVIIDYLQMLQSTNINDSDKRQVDIVMTTLRQMCRDYKIAVIVLSAFNRENYNNLADFKSFKESGSIEYSGDIVLGLQLEAVHHLDGNDNNKRELLNNAKSASTREIELVCLKNRNGVCGFNCLFNYYPKVNYFVEVQKKEDKF